VKYSLEVQKHFIRQPTDKAVEAPKKTKQLFFAVFAPWSVG
jgi:hypothetical protein